MVKKILLIGLLIIALPSIVSADKLVCFDKRTGEVVNDFQSGAKTGTLIDNAVRAGLGSVGDFEERIVSDDEFETLDNQTNDAMRAQSEQEWVQRKADAVKARDKLKALGLTADEVEALFE